MANPTINIEPIICKNQSGNGYLPGIVTNGRHSMSTYSALGYSRDEAEAMALHLAEAEAGRYIGDWNVIVNRKTTEGQWAMKRIHYKWVDGHAKFYMATAKLYQDGIRYHCKQSPEMKKLDRFMIGVDQAHADRLTRVLAAIK